MNFVDESSFNRLKTETIERSQLFISILPIIFFYGNTLKCCVQCSTWYTWVVTLFNVLHDNSIRFRHISVCEMSAISYAGTIQKGLLNGCRATSEWTKMENYMYEIWFWIFIANAQRSRSCKPFIVWIPSQCIQVNLFLSNCRFPLTLTLRNCIEMILFE